MTEAGIVTCHCAGFSAAAAVPRRPMIVIFPGEGAGCGGAIHGCVCHCQCGSRTGIPAAVDGGINLKKRQGANRGFGCGAIEAVFGDDALTVLEYQ